MDSFYLFIYLLHCTPKLSFNATASVVLAQNAGQYHVEGTVIDSASNPVTGAVVSLSTLDGIDIASQMTDIKGSFKFDAISSGKYELLITHLSYVVHSQALEVTGNCFLDTIILAMNPYAIASASIYGSRIQHGSYLPYVTNVDGGIKILGQEVGLMRLNGIKITDPQELEAIQANNLDKIEVVLFSRLDQSGSGPGGEINIKTKKNA